MVIVKAFDQAIWYLKIILPEDTLFAEFTYATATLLQPLPFLKGRKCKPASKGLQKHIYSADGQIVIPPVSRPVRQSVSQAASWAMSTQKYVSITSSPTVMQKQSFMAVKFQGWNVQGATDWRYAPGNLEPFSFFFYPFFTSVLHHCISYLLSGKKNKNTGIWKAADYMKYILDFHIEMRCSSSSFCGLRQIWCQTDYST